MTRLRFDDSAWANLHTRSGSAAWVPEKLAHLTAHPADLAAFSELWPELASEGTAYSAGHAALPYILDIVEMLPRGSRVEHLAFVGILMACTETVVPALREPYERCQPQALKPAADELLHPHGASSTRYLLASVAALKGYPKTADAIQSLDCLAECPECGKEQLEIEG